MQEPNGHKDQAHESNTCVFSALYQRWDAEHQHNHREGTDGNVENTMQLKET